jgi:hypothetical protein
MVTSSVLRSKLLLKYAFCLVAYFWSLSLAQRPRPWSKLPLSERMGRVFIGDLCIFIRRYMHPNGSVFSWRWQRRNFASFLVSTRLYFSIQDLNVVQMYLELMVASIGDNRRYVSVSLRWSRKAGPGFCHTGRPKSLVGFVDNL